MEWQRRTTSAALSPRTRIAQACRQLNMWLEDSVSAALQHHPLERHRVRQHSVEVQPYWARATGAVSASRRAPRSTPRAIAAAAAERPSRPILGHESRGRGGGDPPS